MDLFEMREMFNYNILSIISKKRDDNKSYLSLNEYNARLNDVIQSKNKLQTPKSKKTMKDYRTVRKYDVITINGKNRLIKPNDKSDNVLYYVTTEDLFDILHASHIAILHGGRNRMVTDLKTRYANITKEAIMVYLRLCEGCQRKPSLKRANNLNKNTNKLEGPRNPLSLEPAFNSRAEIDIIDMQAQSYNGFNFLLVHQDHHTKFILLRALKSKLADEIANNLLEIYATFGPPFFIHTKEDQEFISPILKKLYDMCNELKILIGKQSLNLVSDNTEIIKMLNAWMTENKSQDWPLGIQFTQYKKNCEHCSDIGKSPYEALFRRLPEIALPPELGNSDFVPVNDIKVEELIPVEDIKNEVLDISDDTTDQYRESEVDQNDELKVRNYMLAEHCETVMDVHSSHS